MPEPRIGSEKISSLKGWVETNRQTLLTRGIHRIDAHYTDDDLSIGAFDEIHAYTMSGSPPPFTEIRFAATAELHSLLEDLTESDTFFMGQQGGGGVITLLIESGVIEHASFEYATTKHHHDVETY